MAPTNPYDDSSRAEAYAAIGIRNTYYLAYRDLPGLFIKHRISGHALDHGCGTGRSTRFLRDHGFTAVGVDISPAMIAGAREHDPEGDYRLMSTGRFDGLADGQFDLVLSVMPFDSIATQQGKLDALFEISRVLKPGGWATLVVSSRDIYLREWISFSAVDFPENQAARDGDTVRILINEIDDRRAVEDILWSEGAYVETFARTPLRLVETARPLVTPGDEGLHDWISERTHAPWLVFVLRKPVEPS